MGSLAVGAAGAEHRDFEAGTPEHFSRHIARVGHGERGTVIALLESNYTST